MDRFLPYKTMPKTKSDSALAKVQNLYILQVELFNFLDGSVNDDDVAQAKKQLKEFKTLLKEVDPRYMGGEDVYDALAVIIEEVSQKLNKASRPAAAKTRTKTVAKKAAPAKKKTATRKSAAKKTTAKKVTTKKAAPKKKPAAKKKK